MKPGIFLLSSLALTIASAGEAHSLGIFFGWGAFEETRPRRCFAIAEAEGPTRRDGGRPYASIGYWPEAAVRGQLHVRLRAPKRAQSAVLLRIDDRTFQLAGSGIDAWAPDRRADAEIVSAMRTGIEMAVETRSERGGSMRDVYRLRGAATAVDAAAIACARPAGKQP